MPKAAVQFGGTTLSIQLSIKRNLKTPCYASQSGQCTRAQDPTVGVGLAIHRFVSKSDRLAIRCSMSKSGKRLLSITLKSLALESGRLTCGRLSSQQSKSGTRAVVVVNVIVVRIVVAASSSPPANHPTRSMLFSLFTHPQTQGRSGNSPGRYPRCASHKGCGCLANHLQ